MYGYKIQPSKQIKYVGIYIDEHLNFSYHCNFVATKLRRANGMLCKARHFLDQKNLRNLYYAIFNSHLSYGSQVWAQVNTKQTENIYRLQNKALKIISFADWNSSPTPLYFSKKILKLEHQVKLLNCQFVLSCIHNVGPKCFDEYFKFSSDTHNYSTRFSNLGCLQLNPVNTTTYGLNSITFRCIIDWNFITGISKTNLDKLSAQQIKSKVTDYYLQHYCQWQYI